MNILKIKLLDKDLKTFYSKKANVEGDAGVDLYFPENIILPPHSLGTLIDFKIQTEMILDLDLPEDVDMEIPNISFILTPRSSIYKTPLRQSNSIGVIDSGYRGNLMVPIDNHSDEEYKIERGTRLFQVIEPGLRPIRIELVNILSSTERGTSGLGSTGV